MRKVITGTRVAAALHPRKVFHLPVFLRNYSDPLVTQTLAVPVGEDVTELFFLLIREVAFYIDMLARRAERTLVIDVPFPCNLRQDRRCHTFGSWIADKQLLIKNDGGAFCHDLFHRLCPAKYRRQIGCLFMRLGIEPCTLDAESRLNADRVF